MPVDSKICRPVRNGGREDQPIVTTLLLSQPPEFTTASDVHLMDGTEVPRQQFIATLWCWLETAHSHAKCFPDHLARLPARDSAN